MRKPAYPTAAEYPAAGVFLDGYLHQDFGLVHGSATAAAHAFVADANFRTRAETAEGLRGVRTRLRDLAAHGGDWQAALARVGGAWRPAAIEQLDEVIAVIEASVD